MKFGFVTCVQLGLSCIEAVHSIGGKFDLFMTLHDHKSKQKAGRIYLDEVSNKTNTPLIKINHINDQEVVNAIKDYDLDWLFIIGWSQIAKPETFNASKFGTIGAHPTLLPIGRGRAAIPWAIIKGLDKTGVSFFKMDEGVDTGPILGQFEILINESTTATELYKDVDKAHETLIKNLWGKLVEGQFELKMQDEALATYWEGRTPEDGLLNKEMTVNQVATLVRATTKPYPGAFILEDGSKVIIWEGEIGMTKGKQLEFIDGIYTATVYDIVQL
jgi:methionyl-tRNA formyltransferase